MESKGLHVNTKKTNFMVSGVRLGKLQDSGAFPCARSAAMVLEPLLFFALYVLCGYIKHAARLLIH
mgnify:CR=1 FL=1